MTDLHKKAEWQANQVEKWSGLNIRREAANTIRDFSTRLAKKDAALLAAEEALRRIELSTDTKEQGAIAMAALAAMEDTQ